MTSQALISKIHCTISANQKSIVSLMYHNIWDFQLQQVTVSGNSFSELKRFDPFTFLSSL